MRRCMRFYVLRKPEVEEGQEPRFAVTDFVEADPVNTGSGLECPLCGKPVSMLPWLPPYRAELQFWGKEAGDIAFGTGDQLLVSGRFKQLWEKAGLLGLSGFERVEIVKTKNYGRRKKGLKPAGDYYVVRIATSRAAIDDVASGLIREGEGLPCEECRYRGIIKRARSIVLEEGTWSGEDIFYPRGLTGEIITSERYRDFHMSNKINNGLLVPADEYGFDSYPWEKG
jgi:hypothetical protein